LPTEFIKFVTSFHRHTSIMSTSSGKLLNLQVYLIMSTTIYADKSLYQTFHKFSQQSSVTIM